MNANKTVYCWWWGWNPEKVEKCLEEMESEGWNLYQVDMGSVRLKFIKGEHRKLRYCVDFQTKPESTYFSLFNDDGWELVWKGAGGWMIWKKEYSTVRPEIYTDSKSLVGRNNRLIAMLSSITAGLLPIFVVLLTLYKENQFVNFVIWIYVFLFIINGYALLKLSQYNKKLQQDNIKE